LATNSAKYGALSAANGVLKVNWQSEPDGMTLHWQESGGPPVAAPASQGFGTKIMNASIKHQLGGNVTWDWRSSGLHCTLQIPLGMDGDLPNRIVSAAGENLVKLPTGTMKRVLLAEDEAIIGMMMREFLLEYGVFVVGPCCTLSETLAAANTEFDCAILDLNLGGESVYPVASALAERNVPFAFVTGYGRESLGGRFESVPILQKPITRESLETCLHGMLQRSIGGSKKPSPFEDESKASALRA
jgi:CheY-like chemotaxis protein